MRKRERERETSMSAAEELRIAGRGVMVQGERASGRAGSLNGRGRQTQAALRPQRRSDKLPRHEVAAPGQDVVSVSVLDSMSVECRGRQCSPVFRFVSAILVFMPIAVSIVQPVTNSKGSTYRRERNSWVTQFAVMAPCHRSVTRVDDGGGRSESD